MLKAKGYNVHVKNAGKPGDTPWGLLHRLDPAVPSGTKIVLLAKEGLYGNNQLSQLKADEGMNTGTVDPGTSWIYGRRATKRR